MKVLHYVSIMNRAGQETFIMNMYRNIDRSKIQFGFLCTKNAVGDYDEEIFQLGGNIHYIKIDQKMGKLRHIDNYIRMKNEFHAYIEEYDVFHIHNYHAFDTYLAARAAVKAGFKKVVVHSHNASADEHLKLHELCKPLLAKLPLKRLACSSMAGNWMFDENHFEVIPNGINLEKFKYDSELRMEYRKQLMLEDKFVIGHVGRFEKQKNHRFLIDLFEKFAEDKENVHLLMVGNGVLFSDIESRISEKKLQSKITMLGMRTDVYNIYQAMDCFLFPSLFEGLGIVLIEAQATGLPCVITDNFPHEVDINENVIRCSLDSSAEEWIEALNKIYATYGSADRFDCIDNIKNAGFDALSSARKLTRIYLK